MLQILYLLWYRASTEKRIKPIVMSMKCMKGVSYVDQLNFVQNVTYVPVVAQNLRVGSRLHHFWEAWAALGASPKVMRILKEGYTLPFRIWPNRMRSAVVISGCVHPLSNSYLIEALHALMQKNAVEKVRNL